MYVPPHFEVADRAWMLELIAKHPFGMLVTNDGEYPRVSHLPLVAELRGEDLYVVGHVARANPHAHSIVDQVPATIAFAGPHAYVSAAWYEEPYKTVPTWNYTAVHVCGRLRPFDAWYAVKLLTERIERAKGTSWQPERLDRAYRESQLRGIVAFELCAEAIHAKAKLNQNRTEADQRRVMGQLAASPDQTDRECADAMAAVLCRPSTSSGGAAQDDTTVSARSAVLGEARSAESKGQDDK